MPPDDERPEVRQTRFVARVGCGFIFGLAMGLGAWAYLDTRWWWALVLAPAVLFAFLSYRHGDRFWDRARDFWIWW